MTKASLQVLKDAIIKYEVKSMIDVPCGDVNWIFDSLLTDTLPVYVGLDVTSTVIEVNRERFSHHKNKQFHFWDATECDLPRIQNGTSLDLQPVDLIHVRDVIQHLTLEQGMKYFCRVFKSGARVLVTTSHQEGGGQTVNRNVQEGSYYNCNLFLEPFSFPESQKQNCFKHDRQERRAYTCTFDLTEGSWVREFMAAKC
jgi:ubiquinone/menaquinone biosynthesis C-methylase UbiE